MTEGLLTSRRTKQHLYEQTLIDASEASLARYKNFSRIYYKTVIAAKKHSITLAYLPAMPKM
jgi:hypothetical protein